MVLLRALLIVSLVLTGQVVLPARAAATPAPATSEDFEAAKQAAEDAHITDLEELAAWCQKKKAYRERDKTYELILTLRPDHKNARRMLGYTFDRKAEEWVRKREYREPKRSRPAVTLEAIDKRKQTMEAQVERMVDVLEAHTETLDPEVKRTEMRALLAEHPDHERLRALAGHVRVPIKGGTDRWMGKVAANAILRSRELRAMRTKALEEADRAEPTVVEDQESGLGFEWKHTLQNNRMRVLTTGERSEAAQVLRQVSMLWAYLPEILGGDLKPGPDDAIYLLIEEEESSAFRDNFPLVSDDNREYWDVVRGTYLGNTTRMCLHGADEVGRLDMIMRQTVGLYLWQGYGIRGTRGWLTEGIGLYLVHQMVGTRLSMTLTKSEYTKTDTDYTARIGRGNNDWLDLAADMIRKDDAPNLSFVVGKNVGAMAARDLIIANALAAYLIEGQGKQKTAEILRRVGGSPTEGIEGEASALVLSDVLQTPLSEIYPQLLEWLDQVRPSASDD